MTPVKPEPSRIAAGGASVFAGTFWLVWELSRRSWDDGASSACVGAADYFNDGAFALANLSAALALTFLAVTFRGALRALAVVGAIGAFAIAAGNGLEHCVAEPFFLLYVAGSLAYVLVSLALTVGLFARGYFGRWRCLLIGLAALGLMFGAERGGAAVTGAAWLAFGVSLLTAQRRTPVAAPAP